MKTQCQKLATLLTSKRGTTSMEIIRVCGTVAPHRRLSDLKDRGWIITAKQVPDHNYNRYFGLPPVALDKGQRNK